MASEDSFANGREQLQAALATLIQNQAAFVTAHADIERRHAENERRHLEFERRHLEFQRENAETIAQIKAQMSEIIRVLNDHTKHLERLTEAIREKIGFKAP